MNVARYVRVSTTRQQQSQTIEPPRARLQDDVATPRAWHLAEEHIDRDDGYSGAKLNRPGLDGLRDRAAFAAFERVLITTPDRLARHFTHQRLLIEALSQRGCEVACLDRPMRADPHDPLLRHIRGAVAEDERTLMAARMRRGRQATCRSGQRLPWSRAPDGDSWDPDRPRDSNRVRLDPVQAAVVAHILAWDYRATDAGQPLWGCQAPERGEDTDGQRHIALECRHGAWPPAFLRLCGHGLLGTHPAGSSTPPHIRVAAGWPRREPSARAARGMDRQPGAGDYQPRDL